MPFGLPEEALCRIREILAGEPRVQRARLFGSRARGDERPASDIDLCLEGEGLDLRTLLALQTRLDALELPWKIDLLAWDGIADPALREGIRAHGQVIFDRGTTREAG